MNFVGYFMIWLAVTGRIHKPQVWQMCLYICIGANSQNFTNTGSVVSCVVNFPENRGVMLGLLKGFVGLSGAIMTQLYLAIYGNDSKSLILLIAWFPVALLVIFAYAVRVIKPERHPNELKVLYHFLYVTIVLAIFLMVITILEKQFDFSHGAYAGCASTISAILFTLFLIVIREEWITWNHKTNIEAIKPSFELTTQQPTTIIEAIEEATELRDKKEEEKAKKSCFLTIFDKPERAIGYLMIAFPFPGSVYLASVIIGFSFGAQLPLLFAIISEIFGLKYYSTLFNCGQLVFPLGSYILNVKVTGKLYDDVALKQLHAKGLDRSSVNELVCLGVSCFRKAFIILSSVAVFGGIISLILVMRTRKFYSGDIYKKYRER